jgi:hypothetical protein
MALTRGGLDAARIYSVTKAGVEDGKISIPCMFNPYEYSVTKTNSFDSNPQNGSNTPNFQFKQAGPQTLKLTLHFDTYELNKDVSRTTVNLWKLMEPLQEGSDNQKKEPPRVAFEWGVFLFRAVITNMTQKFTLFNKDGTPVRAQVDVTFTQYKDEKDYKHQNPTSGGGPIERVWVVVRGDRLDTIAAAVYGDATQWRHIAEYNDLLNPLALTPGQRFIIPKL